MNFFGDNLLSPFRAKQFGKAFRKGLGVYSYKFKGPGYHKKPGLIDLKQKERLLKVNNNIINTANIKHI